MPGLSETGLLFALLALAVILVVGRATAEIARRLDQPEVLGELVGGFLLGPSIFGAVFPAARQALFLRPGVGVALSALSWLGAILLLFVAGVEVDLGILRRQARPGLLGAAFAIVPSLAAGTIFANLVLHRPLQHSFFLGIVLSVAAVSVAAKVLMERGMLRREYAQVILAAGVASETLVWLLVSVAASLHAASPLLAGVKAAAFAVAFFLFMMTAGRRFVFWAMRKVADRTQIINGQLSLVLVLAFLAAALTQALGLHALLGAFMVGVLLGQAPRANEELMERVQTLTVGLFAPIFFVLAGMRVDILQIASLPAALAVALLFVVASGVKVGFGTLGARLGGLRGWESALVGVGLNLKGGTDVVVAIVGVELGLLSSRAYTMYTVVAILTVLVSPVLLARLEAKSPPTEAEEERLAKEEASRRSYLPRVERVLVPVLPQLLPALAAGTVEKIASAKNAEKQLFDITQFVINDARKPKAVGAAVAETQNHLEPANRLKDVQITERRVDVAKVVPAILEEAKDYDLIALGARPPEAVTRLSFGRLQDAIIDQTEKDVLVAVDQEAARFDCSKVDRILVPLNGLEYSLAAADVAAYLAKSCDATLVAMVVVQPRMDSMFWRQRDDRRLREIGRSVLQEVSFRLNRLGIEVEECVEVADDAGQAILKELQGGSYGLVVAGAVDRGGDHQVVLGATVQHILTHGNTPAVVLIRHE